MSIIYSKTLTIISIGFMLILICSFELQAQQPPADRFLDVIVRLDESLAPGGTAANRSQAVQIALALGVNPRYAYGAAFFGFAASVPEQRLATIQANPWVAYVNIDTQVWAVAPKWCPENPNHPACIDEGDTGGSVPGGQILPWGIDRIDAEINANTGAGIHVYVIDSGIDMDHQDLQANIGTSVSCVNSSGGPPWSRNYTCESGGNDDNGHGTHVAGTIGAIDNDIGVIGVAPDVTLHAVKVLGANGSGSVSQVIAGIDWVRGQVTGTAVVANMSLGGGGSKSGSCANGSYIGTDAFHEAVCNATNAGVVFVVAAGNEDADAEGSVPAAYDDAVITVSATEEGDNWPYWSNWGNNVAAWTVHVSAPVTIAAPGVDILSTWNDGGTNTISGTSMATPHVAGAAALFLESNPQAANYTAFVNTRNGLLAADESTGSFSNSSGNPHDEDFLDAGGL